MTRKCLLCNSDFDVHSAGQRYCNQECSTKAHPKQCETCGDTFYHRDKRRFCSLICANKRVRKPGCDVSKCLHCGGDFYNNYKHDRKYCSGYCSTRVNRGDRHGHKIHRKKQGSSVATTILEINSAARCRILRKMNLGCSYCGWDKANCDIHHINGKMIISPNDQSNLCYLCPNCHRLAGRSIIKPEELTPFSIQVGMKWKEYYCGSS